MFRYSCDVVRRTLSTCTLASRTIVYPVPRLIRIQNGIECAWNRHLLAEGLSEVCRGITTKLNWLLVLRWISDATNHVPGMSSGDFPCSRQLKTVVFFLITRSALSGRSMGRDTRTPSIANITCSGHATSAIAPKCALARIVKIEARRKYRPPVLGHRTRARFIGGLLRNHSICRFQSARSW